MIVRKNINKIFFENNIVLYSFLLFLALPIGFILILKLSDLSIPSENINFFKASKIFNLKIQNIIKNFSNNTFILKKVFLFLVILILSINLGLLVYQRYTKSKSPLILKETNTESPLILKEINTKSINSTFVNIMKKLKIFSFSSLLFVFFCFFIDFFYHFYQSGPALFSITRLYIAHLFDSTWQKLNRKEKWVLFLIFIGEYIKAFLFIKKLFDLISFNDLNLSISAITKITQHAISSKTEQEDFILALKTDNNSRLSTVLLTLLNYIIIHRQNMKLTEIFCYLERKLPVDMLEAIFSTGKKSISTDNHIFIKFQLERNSKLALMVMPKVFYYKLFSLGLVTMIVSWNNYLIERLISINNSDSNEFNKKAKNFLINSFKENNKEILELFAPENDILISFDNITKKYSSLKQFLFSETMKKAYLQKAFSNASILKLRKLDDNLQYKKFVKRVENNVDCAVLNEFTIALSTINELYTLFSNEENFFTSFSEKRNLKELFFREKNLATLSLSELEPNYFKFDLYSLNREVINYIIKQEISSVFSFKDFYNKRLFAVISCIEGIFRKQDPLACRESLNLEITKKGLRYIHIQDCSNYDNS